MYGGNEYAWNGKSPGIKNNQDLFFFQMGVFAFYCRMIKRIFFVGLLFVCCRPIFVSLFFVDLVATSNYIVLFCSAQFSVVLSLSFTPAVSCFINLDLLVFS